MKIQDLRPGNKVDIKILQEAKREEIGRVEAASFLSSVFDVRSDDTIELMMPTQGGKVVLLSPAVRYEFIFTTEEGMFKGEGIISERFKRGNFYLIRIRLRNGLEKYQRREFYRLSCMLPMVYSSLSEEVENTTSMEEVRGIIRHTDFKSIKRGYGTILDISGGGIRFSSETDLSDIDYLLMQFSLELKEGRKSMEVMGKIVGTSKKEDAGVYINRVKILFKDSDFQEKIIQFIFEEERRIRRKGSGIE